jgi:DNA-directed RNA polymerase specialized sigma24 family protein
LGRVLPALPQLRLRARPPRRPDPRRGRGSRAGGLRPRGPNRGTFRGWLAQLTRWRIADKFRARPRDAAAGPSRRSQEFTDATRTIERIADDKTSTLDDLTETEWQKHVLDAALGRLARRVPAKHFQAFDFYSRQGWPVMRVARELGINPAAVYLISHRLTKQLKAEVAALRASLG